MIAVIDYGVGNLFSLCSSLKYIGEEAVVSGDADVIKKADRLILPGVGAFADAAKKLSESGIGDVIKSEAASGKPIMGICLGMQLLFDVSYEYGEHKGLGLIGGNVKPIGDVIPNRLKIPHIGWNALIKKKDHPFLKNVDDGECVYFVHSFYASDCDESVIATAEYGAELTAAAAYKNVVGCQFHPEKSGDVGMRILKAFAREDIS